MIVAFSPAVSVSSLLLKEIVGIVVSTVSLIMASSVLVFPARSETCPAAMESWPSAVLSAVGVKVPV